jgi:hypothetical protein
MPHGDERLHRAYVSSQDSVMRTVIYCVLTCVLSCAATATIALVMHVSSRNDQMRQYMEQIYNSDKAYYSARKTAQDLNVDPEKVAHFMINLQMADLYSHCSYRPPE